MADRWHILRDGPVLTLARQLPARFDVWAETWLPIAGRLRVAHQVRQDVWRELRDLRGFSPVVEVRRDADRLHLRAGGRLMSSPGNRQKIEFRIAALLADPALRSRWVRWAGNARKVGEETQ